MERTNLKALGLTVSVALAVLLIMALALALPGTSPALTNAIRFVDGAGGADAGNCTGPPCDTIGYALAQAAAGDEIHVAQGTYNEVLDIVLSVNLRGGYEAGAGPATLRTRRPSSRVMARTGR